ncbi:MAG TPA: methionyl-tRNA formyltransferase, partial [Acholeplasmataceae bacterium]|nr:methionyl-tRNA formyltransferase [Acholeplasmataceae bacterium]
MKIVFMGTPEFAIPSLDSLIKNNFEVILVVTQPDRYQGRKRNIIYSPVKKYALDNNLAIIQPVKIKESVDFIIEQKPDLIITAAYGQILPRKLLDNVKAINVHGSLLPKYRGGAPIQYSLFDGLEETGVTIMDMAYKMDSGDIIKQGIVKIDELDNYGTLSDKLASLGAKLLIDVLNNNYPRIKQDENLVTFAYTLKRSDEFLDFNNSSGDNINRLRGLLPNIGASFEINDTILKIYNAKNSDIISNTP